MKRSGNSGAPPGAGPMSLKRVTLLVSGSVAAVKTYELVRLLQKSGAEVEVALTAAACDFVTPQAFKALGIPAHVKDDAGQMTHLALARRADLLLVAPATASLLGKVASGVADDLVSTVLLAAAKPLFIAPAMNPQMWANPLVRSNLQSLMDGGAHLLEPAAGVLACGDEGTGRMMEPELIVARLAEFLASGMPLCGRTALVTAGATREPIDDVRFIGNHSTGLQGYEIAKALCRMGAETTLVSGKSHLESPRIHHFVETPTAADMRRECLQRLPQDIFVSAAAVGDWRVVKPSRGKLSSAKPPNLALEKNPDILKEVGRAQNRRPRLVVGFAAQSSRPTKDGEKRLVAAARRKLKQKGCDWLVANDVSPQSEGGFASENNRVWLFAGGVVEKWETAPKSVIAEGLAARIAAHFTAPMDADGLKDHA